MKNIQYTYIYTHLYTLVVFDTILMDLFTPTIISTFSVGALEDFR